MFSRSSDLAILAFLGAAGVVALAVDGADDPLDRPAEVAGSFLQAVGEEFVGLAGLVVVEDVGGLDDLEGLASVDLTGFERGQGVRQAVDEGLGVADFAFGLGFVHPECEHEFGGDGSSGSGAGGEFGDGAFVVGVESADVGVQTGDVVEHGGGSSPFLGIECSPHASTIPIMRSGVHR